MVAFFSCSLNFGFMEEYSWKETGAGFMGRAARMFWRVENIERTRWHIETD
jgi:hypothetical protein